MNFEYVLWRSLQSILLIFLISVVVFLLLFITPGDPVAIMLGDYGTPEQITALRHEMGFDLPFHQQFGRFLINALHGNFGRSIVAQKPALEHVIQRLPATLILTGGAFLIALLIGLPVGIVSAVKRGNLWDHGSMFFALLGQSMPVFWLGLMMIVIFGVELGWLPVSGRGGIKHMILPCFTLGVVQLGLIIRLTRSSMLEVLSQDYVRTAWAKGLSGRIVLMRHALRNALIPLVTVIGMRVGYLLGGAVITETVFAWPGLGSVAVIAIHQRDYPVVQASVFLCSLFVVIANWLVDILYSYLDPRIRI